MTQKNNLYQYYFQYNSVMKISNENMLHNIDIFISESVHCGSFIHWFDKINFFLQKQNCKNSIQSSGKKNLDDLLNTMYFCNVRMFVFTLISRDGGHFFCRGGQAEDPSAVDASLCLHVVLKGAVHPSRQTGHILRLKYQLGEGRSAAPGGTHKFIIDSLVIKISATTLQKRLPGHSAPNSPFSSSSK